MRVAYNTPSVSEFENLFSDDNFRIKGGSLTDIQSYNAPVYIQRGSGVFGILGNLVRNSIPFIRRLILPAVSDFSQNVMHDYANGRPMRQALKKHGISSIKKLGKQIIRGGKRKNVKINNKRRNAQTQRRKKQKKCHVNDDIFTHRFK